VISSLDEMDFQASSLQPSMELSTRFGIYESASQCIDQAFRHNIQARQLSFSNLVLASSMACLAIWGRPVLIHAAMRGHKSTVMNSNPAIKSRTQGSVFSFFLFLNQAKITSYSSNLCSIHSSFSFTFCFSTPLMFSAPSG